MQHATFAVKTTATDQELGTFTAARQQLVGGSSGET